MAKKYFFKLGMSYVPANRLDAEINDHIKSLDGCLINSEEEKELFCTSLKNKVEELHNNHPRCKNIRLEIWSHSKIDESLNCGCSRGTIYDVEQEYEPDVCYVGCTSCSKQVDIEKAEEDSDSNYFCKECYDELAPVMKAQYEEAVRNGEIDPIQ